MLQELEGSGGAASLSNASVELHAMELEGYGPFRQALHPCQLPWSTLPFKHSTSIPGAKCQASRRRAQLDLPMPMLWSSKIDFSCF